MDEIKSFNVSLSISSNWAKIDTNKLAAYIFIEILFLYLHHFICDTRRWSEAIRKNGIESIRMDSMKLFRQ